tara:strand:- start:6 stop:302 length:297 start_codon:yes stop_codon:yes gene_type:complete
LVNDIFAEPEIACAEYTLVVALGVINDAELLLVHTPAAIPVVPISTASANGKPAQIKPTAETAIELEPVTDPHTVTRFPTFVYRPIELNVPLTVRPAP